MDDPTDDIDPTAVMTVGQLAEHMRWVRARANNISYRELERWGDEHGKPLPRTTLLEVLHGRRFPRKSVLLAFIEACGIDPAVDPRWEQVWNRLNDELNFPDLSVPTTPTVRAGDVGDERVLPSPALPDELWEQAQELLQQARLSAATIESKARDEARRIVERARNDAAGIRSSAERDAERIRQAAVERVEREVEELREQALRELAEEVDALEQNRFSLGEARGGQRPPERPERDAESRSKWRFGR